MVVIPPLQVENRAIEANIAPPLIGNRIGRLRVKRAQQRLCNTSGKEIKNLKANLVFKCQKKDFKAIKLEVKKELQE